MFKKSSTICLKYIQKYDSHKYEDVTNEALDFLGFRIRENEPDTSVDDVTNINDNVISILNDDENSEMQNSRSINTSPSRENFCDTWLRADSPHFMLVKRQAIKYDMKKVYIVKSNRMYHNFREMWTSGMNTYNLNYAKPSKDRHFAFVIIHHGLYRI